MRKTAILVVTSMVLSLGANLSSSAMAALLTLMLTLGASSALAQNAGKLRQQNLNARSRVELTESGKVGSDSDRASSYEFEAKPRRNRCETEEPEIPFEEREEVDPQEYERLLEQTKAINPPEDRFEFLGYLKPANSDVWVHPSIKPATSLHELLEAAQIEFPRQGDDAARGVLVSADGRVFLERNNVYQTRLRELLSMPEDGQSRSGGTDYVGDGDVDPDPGDTEGGESGPAKDTIFGSDGRSLRTTSSYPWRAVGVSVLSQNGSGWSRGAGSASMIGPRAALTAAHVISSNGSSWNVLRVAPAARGFSWCNGSGNNSSATCKFPFGLRIVQWYYWPGQWEGGGAKYDYGVLILQNQNWSPGWVQFGYQTATWLDWRNMNHAGYPSPSKSCSDTPDNDGECGGYMYRQYENTRSVYTNVAYHKFDVQEGQSGAPIYNSSGGNRTVYLLHRGSNGTSAWAKKLRSGSFNTICNWVDNWPSSFFSNVNCP